VLLGALAAAWVAACSDGPTGVAPEGAVDLAAPWTVAEPQEVGLDPNRLHLAGERAGSIGRMRSLVVVRDGRIVYERYYGGSTAATSADLRSVTKSVVGILVGIALEDGDIASVDQPITDFLDARYASRSDLELVTIRHLLSMTSGFDWAETGPDAYNDWIRSEDHIGYLLEPPLSDPPGSTFVYNSAAVHLLGVILERATGTSLPVYADRRLFSRLGISRSEWELLPDGYNGSAGLDLRPRDAARIGQLLLQGGWSGERSIVPTDWIREIVTPRQAVAGGVGPITSLAYGYLWWADPDRQAFFAWGFGGQFVYVWPELDMVVVATTDWRDVREDIGPVKLQDQVMSVIVDHVLSAGR